MEEESDFLETNSLYRRNSGNLSWIDGSDFGKINPNLFEQSNEMGIKTLFTDTTSSVIANEICKFEHNLKKYMRNFCNKEKSHTAARNNKPATFKKVARDILVNNFDSHFSCIFPSGFFGLNSVKTSNEQAHSICSNFLDFCFSALNQLAENFFDESRQGEIEDQLFDSTTTDKSQKRGWTKAEEDELAALIEHFFPENIPQEKLAMLAEKYKRTKSAIANKMHKMKKKCEENFMKKNENILNDFLDSGKPKKSMKEKVVDMISWSGQLTYEEIISSLKLSKCESESENQVDLILYNLLTEEKIRCDEKIYVDFIGENCNINSPILQRVAQALLKSNKTMLFDHVKTFLIKEFAEINPNQPNFEADLISYLTQSKLFVVKAKRVFIPS